MDDSSNPFKCQLFFGMYNPTRRDNMALGKVQIIAIVAVVAVAAAGIGIGVYIMNNNNSKDTTAPEYCDNILSAINKATDKHTEEYLADEENTDTNAQLLHQEGKSPRWIKVALKDAKTEYDTAKANEKFAANITNPTIKVMSNTFTCHHITYHDGLTDGCGYWYTYTDTYTIFEYIGYDADSDKYISMKMRLEIKSGATDDDINKVIEAAIGALKA